MTAPTSAPAVLVLEFPITDDGLDKTTVQLRDEARSQVPDLLFEIRATWTGEPAWRVDVSERVESPTGLSLFAEAPGEPWTDPVRYRSRDWFRP